MNKITIKVLGERAADGWIDAGADRTASARRMVEYRRECNLPTEPDMCDDEGNRIPAECEVEFVDAFWARIEEVAR